MTQRCLCYPPFIQHISSPDIMPGIILDVENRENQTQVLLMWRPQSSDHAIAQSLHQQRVELSLYPFPLLFPTKFKFAT